MTSTVRDARVNVLLDKIRLQNQGFRDINVANILGLPKSRISDFRAGRREPTTEVVVAMCALTNESYPYWQLQVAADTLDRIGEPARAKKLDAESLRYLN